ncbi:EbsA family protein [Marinilactibacillus kalidii]|uniref:EbsA family protein n=1 Tax=Marinilactibacillus kalidii TaxID=2820274 RepID=UPI001ABE1314|nr:EbsA family protein [Marinilactibacillus kalidii]
MKTKTQELSQSSNKIKLSLEPAFQTIFISSIFISFCITIVITTTLARFNWGTVAFAIITLLLFYLKKETYIKIEEEQLYFCYFAGLKKAFIPISDIQGLIVTEHKRLTILELKTDKTYEFYLNKSNQARLNHWAQSKGLPMNALHLNYSKKD